MRTPGRGLMVALVCLSHVCLSIVCLPIFAVAQRSDQVIAERVLGAQWKQLSHRAGMIFAGTVLNSTLPTATIGRAAPVVRVTFRVDRAIAGVERGQVLTIHEWTGAMHRPMRAGQHMLLFLYPRSRLGLTSPVGGSLGQVALDASGKNVSGAGFANTLQAGRHVPQGLKPAFFQDLNATAEAAPYPKPIFETSSKSERRPAGAVGPRDEPSPQPRGPTDNGTVSVVQLERAIRSARSEQE